MNLDELRDDCATKQKKGLHFILASIVIWTGILMVHLSSLNILDKNLYTFFCTAPLMPLAFIISKWIKVDFQNKTNPINTLGIVFSVNQILYLIIAMWVFSAMPDKMVMVIAMIFGAHLMPYGWLYKSKSYFVFSVVIPILALYMGLKFEPYVLAATMISVEILFSSLLVMENKVASKQLQI